MTHGIVYATGAISVISVVHCQYVRVWKLSEKGVDSMLAIKNLQDGSMPLSFIDLRQSHEVTAHRRDTERQISWFYAALPFSSAMCPGTTNNVASTS